MKKYLYLAITLFVAAACGSNQNGYLIKGTFTGNASKYNGKEVYLISQTEGASLTDTAVVSGDSFKFKGTATDPHNASMKIEGVPGVVPIFLENYSYKVTIPVDSLRGSVVEGGETQEIITNLAKAKKTISAKYNMQALMAEYTKGNPGEKRKKEILDTYSNYKKELQSKEKEILANASPYTFYSLEEISDRIDINPIDTTDSLLVPYRKNPKFQNTTILKNIEKEVAAIKSLQPGNVAPDFTLPGSNGKNITFSDVYKANKITMIDFWASWCNPCRSQNPQLVGIYNDYRERGFQILGRFDGQQSRRMAKSRQGG
jgi:hypothetical protein